MPKIAEKMGFSCFDLEMGTRRVFKKWPKFISWAAPILIFCVFGCRASILQKRVLENQPNLSETTENVVPKCRGQKSNFCTRGSEIGIFRSGSNMVPKDFSFHGTSFPTHLQEDKENCFIFLAFSLIDNRSFYFFKNACLLCHKYLSLLFLVLFNCCCSCWLRLFVFLGASASDYISSFLFSLDFVFLPVFFFSFFWGCMYFCSYYLSYPPPVYFFLLCFLL